MAMNDIDLAALDRDLQKLKKPQRGWWARNWKRILTVIILLILAGVGYAGWYFYKLFGNEAYKQAMSKIRENQEITAILGEPIKQVYLTPLHSFTKDGNDFEMRWEVIGANQKQAKVDVKTRLMNGNWGTVYMEVELPGGKKIRLNADEGGNEAPKYNPQPVPDAKQSGKSPDEDMPDDLSPKIPSPEESE
jgi:hypothetical protein